MICFHLERTNFLLSAVVCHDADVDMAPKTNLHTITSFEKKTSQIHDIIMNTPSQISVLTN